MMQTVNGIPHDVTPDASGRAVFCAEMRESSDARAEPHTGLGVVEAWLDPALPGPRLAAIRLADGRLVYRAAFALRPADNVAARRILPTVTVAARRLA